MNAEVLHALRAHRLRGLLAEDEAEAARRALLGLAITRYPTLGLIARAWELRHNFTAYDAMYVALAEVLERPLATADAPLAAAARDHTNVRVILLGESAAGG